MIKRCNDFGAGGVCVAVGELAPGLVIELDAVPKKYEGLDGTELAISESQERMACVIAPDMLERFKQMAYEENLEATQVAVVTEEARLVMHWRGKTIVDLSRAFLDTNGVTQHAEAEVAAPDEAAPYLTKKPDFAKDRTVREAWLAMLSDLNICSQKGLVERFDGTIGAGTILAPYGGVYRDSPNEAMAALIPTPGETTTATLMSHGYDPELSTWSPFHGAVYAVTESLAKICAAGGDVSRARLTFQEYFERLNRNKLSWGKPAAALLGGPERPARLWNGLHRRQGFHERHVRGYPCSADARFLRRGHGGRAQRRLHRSQGRGGTSTGAADAAGGRRAHAGIRQGADAL